MTLKPCPCGQTPASLVTISLTCRDEWTNDGKALDLWTIAGDCCGKWMVSLHLPELCPNAETYFPEAWNAAPRAEVRG